MPDFLFVVKTSSSELLTRSKDEERMHIFSHVQSRRRRGQKPARASEPWMTYASTLELPARDLSGRSSPGTPGTPSPGSSGSGSSTPTPPPPPPPRLSLTCPSNNGADPFFSTVAGSDIRTHAILSYAFDSFARVTFLAEAFAPPAAVQGRGRMRHARAVGLRLRRCVGDDMLMYATLAYGSSCMGWTLGVVQADAPPEYFIGQALQRVRARLGERGGGPPDQWLLLSVYAMAITELWSGIPEMWSKCPARARRADRKRLGACRTHLRALAALVDQAGGWQAVDSYVTESAILADKFLYFYGDEPPVLPLSWDPGHFPAARMELLGAGRGCLPRLGEALLLMDLPEPMRAIFEDLVGYVRIAQCAWSSPDMTDEDERWLFLRLQALTYRLISLHTSDYVQSCTRTSALLFLLNATEYEGSQIGVPVLLAQLRSDLAQSDMIGAGLGSGLLTWWLFNAATARTASPERQWFAGTIADVFWVAEEKPTTTQLRDGLQSYLYLPDRQERQLLSVFDLLG